MSKIKHIGRRPQYPVQVLDFKRKTYIEEFPDGSYKIWNKKMLNSGCDGVVEEIKELYDCIYCPHCNEYFSKDQWEDEHQGDRRD